MYHQIFKNLKKFSFKKSRDIYCGLLQIFKSFMSSLSLEEKGDIYDILVSSKVWKNFFIVDPLQSERSSNIKALFSDISNDDEILINESENVLFLYKFSSLELHPHIKNIFSKTEIFS